MDIVTVLGIIECLGIVTDRTEVAHLVRLLQDSPCGILGGVHFKGVRVSRVGLLEDG
jgi:hypothetical protein